MHIEIGIIDGARIVAANVAAAGLVATQLPHFIKKPADLVKTGLAALSFSVLMQAWHMPVGPSELHLIGATTVYLLFGFVPTLVGFGLGLLLQTLLEPQDLYHVGVNSLSLMLPLILVHMSYGKRLFATGGNDRFSLAKVLRLDAIYYAGVAAMVAFWLMVSNVPMPVEAWARWALAYAPVVLLEALITFGAVTLIARWKDHRPVQLYSAVPQLNLA